MKVAIQCSSFGQRCGISTYSNRVDRYLNGVKNVSSKLFVERIRNGIDVICINYEPGLIPPQQLNYFINKYTKVPIVITAHHIGNLPQFYPAIDGVILHSKDQIPGNTPEQIKQNEPWDYIVIPHPALVFPKKDKKKLRKKYGLPEDKLVIGTAGFIVGTGKEIPNMSNLLIRNLKDDEFFYCITSMWKGGDWGKIDKTMSKVKKSGREKQFRMDSDFVSDEILNEKMQCCDLLFAWNNMYYGTHKGSQSGIAADMYGSRVKTIVKDGPHYSFIGQQEKVLVGRPQPEQFIEDVLKALRSDQLKDIQDPKHLSWETMIHQYVEYFRQFLEK